MEPDTNTVEEAPSPVHSADKPAANGISVPTRTPARALFGGLLFLALLAFGIALYWGDRRCGGLQAPRTAIDSASAERRSAGVPPLAERSAGQYERPPSAASSTLLPQAQVIAISLQEDAERVFVGIQLSRDTEYQVRRLPQPERVYIDMRETQLAPGWRSQLKVPSSGLVTAVRSSVTAARARIVFDLGRPAIFLVVGPNARHRVTLCLYPQ